MPIACATHPALFIDQTSSTAALQIDVKAALARYDERLPALFVPLLERLTIQERQAINANHSISVVAEMWEVNAATLRALLLPVPSGVIALPAIDDGASAASACGCDWHGSGESRLVEPGSSYSSAEMLLAHIARDWSVHGAVPRARTHRPIHRALASLRRARRRPLRVFVPGAGLCRLAFEIARRGDRVEANDASAMMVIAARALIGARSGGDRRHWRLFPRAACAGGLVPRETCTHAATVPDLTEAESSWRRRPARHERSTCSASASAAGRLTLHVGSWCDDVYGARSNASFDAVATSYFLDALPDPAAAIRTVRRLLRPGGVWLNVGPLLWHHPKAGMLRMPLDELSALLKLHGFGRVTSRRLGAVPYLETPGGHGHGGVLARLGLRGGRARLRDAIQAGDEWHDVVFFDAQLGGES